MNRFRWFLLRLLARRLNKIELLGWAAGNAGYTDLPILRADYFSVYATNQGPES